MTPPVHPVGEPAGAQGVVPPDDERVNTSGAAGSGPLHSAKRLGRRRRWVLAAGVVVLTVAVTVLAISGYGGGGLAPPLSVGMVPGAGPDMATPAAVSLPPTGVDVMSFGARGDGATDDAPAIRLALASADGVYVPAGTYLLNSYVTPRSAVVGADFVFALRSGQSIVAAPGAVFKMADGVILTSTAAWGGNVFLGNEVHDVSISGLTLDLNGEHNLVSPGRVVTGYGLYLSAAERVHLRGLTMRDTPGQNYVVAQNGGSDIEVRGSTFHNGGTSLPGNTFQNDFSALYFTAADVTVDRVTIDHDTQPFTYSGGVELHGSGGSVTNSSISKSWPAVYIGPDARTGLASMQNTTVTHNAFLDCGRGIVFNAGGTGAIDAVDISQNIFRLVSFAAFPQEPARGIDQDSPVDGRWTYHHIISGLTIASNDFDVDASASDATIRLSQVHSATIQLNRVHDAPGSVLVLGSSPWGTTGVIFRDNQATLAPSPSQPAIVLAFDGRATSPPATTFAASEIRVIDNMIGLADATPSACGVYAAWPSGAPVSDVVVRGNSLVNVGQATCGPQAAALSTA